MSRDRIEDLLAGLTLDEKASLTAGVDMWHGASVERLGIPPLKVTDGPVGARGAHWVGTTSACAPCGTALGATWNTELVGAVGTVLGEEARSKAADVLLAPTVNLHRHPLAGRNFECYSEDPFLTAQLASAFIRGVQSTGVAACVKHLVANDSEHERHTISSEVDERTLRELYLVPFEAAVLDADVRSVMTAYNRLNGTYCAESDWLLNVVLKGEWSFDGVVMSDWWGAKSPASAEGGLDLEMPGPSIHLGGTVAERIRAGDLDEATVDEMVRRVLRLLEWTGRLDDGSHAPEQSLDLLDHTGVLRAAAEEAVVLLRNDPVDGVPVLPIDIATVRTVAVIGPNADAPTILGGGSAAVNPHHSVTVLEGLRRRLGEGVAIHHEQGVEAGRSARAIEARFCRPPDESFGPDGLVVEYFDNRELAGDPVHVERTTSTRLVWLGEPGNGVTGGNFSVRVRGRFRPPHSGTHTFGLVSGGSARLSIDGEVILDNFDDWKQGTTFFGLGSEEIRASVELREGVEVELVAEYVVFDDVKAAVLMIGRIAPLPDDALERAVAAASAADVAVVVVGLDQDSETEGEDRRSLSLPGAQDELIRAVTAANPRSVVLVNAGSPVDLSAAAETPALAQLWYLGQETGDAVAALLVGDVSPAGRLPTTFGRRLEDWPSFLNYPGDGGRVLYGEQGFMGYRGFDARDIEPEFCFGHGLSYTTFTWGEARTDRATVTVDELDAGHTLRVTVKVTNTGRRAGAEVVQCYVRERHPSLRRPPRELKAFAKVSLEAGESRDVTLTLGRRAFAHWNLGSGAWVVQPGQFDVELGASSRDLRSASVIDITG